MARILKKALCLTASVAIILSCLMAAPALAAETPRDENPINPIVEQPINLPGPFSQMRDEIPFVDKTAFSDTYETDRYIVKFKEGSETGFTKKVRKETGLSNAIQSIEPMGQRKETRQSKTSLLLLDKKMAPSQFAGMLQKAGLGEDIWYIQPDHELFLTGLDDSASFEYILNLDMRVKDLQSDDSQNKDYQTNDLPKNNEIPPIPP